jgi:hypothetical protein
MQIVSPLAPAGQILINLAYMTNIVFPLAPAVHILVNFVKHEQIVSSLIEE